MMRVPLLNVVAFAEMAVAEDKMQTQRFELKYKISEDLALQARDFVRSYLEPDEFSAGRDDYSYDVHSLYLDSDELTLYWETINGNKNRYKLRLRYYDDHPDSPVFFEIKRRMNNCILKQRGGVRRDAVQWLLTGHTPEPQHLLKPHDAKSLVALQRFCTHMSHLRAYPKAHIFYKREAWMPPQDNAVRVTFDREVGCDPHFTLDAATAVVNPRYPMRPWVILEIKFTNRYPAWLQDLVRCCNLTITGAAKYVEGVAACGESLFEHHDPLQDGINEPPPFDSRMGRELLSED